MTTALLGVAPLLIASNAAGIELLSSWLLHGRAAPPPLTDHYTSRRLGFLHLSILIAAWASLEIGFLTGDGSFAQAAGALLLMGAVLLPLLISRTANGSWLPPLRARRQGERR